MTGSSSNGVTRASTGLDQTLLPLLANVLLALQRTARKWFREWNACIVIAGARQGRQIGSATTADGGRIKRAYGRALSFDYRPAEQGVSTP